MMKRIIALLTTVFFVCTVAMANEEFNLTFEKSDTVPQTMNLGYGNISFKLVEESVNDYRVVVSIENTTTSQAILLFKNSKKEQVLKKDTPKIRFEKKFPGNKGERTVWGCRALRESVVPIIPEQKCEILAIKVDNKPGTYKTVLELPLYLAKYNYKKLAKKDIYHIDYTILSLDSLSFNIEVKGWTEDDPDYVSTKTAVDEYVSSLEQVNFCDNKKHSPSLVDQQKPYKQTRDSLVNVINLTLEKNQQWQSIDLPYKKYSALRDKLANVDFDKHISDCGEHPVIKPRPSCDYCSLSAPQIYHELEDIYKQLRSGKLTKDAAVNEAQGLYNCYQNHNRRSKDSFYTEKITRYYRRIINY